jgi:hypothetical protein
MWEVLHCGERFVATFCGWRWTLLQPDGPQSQGAARE